MDEDGQSCNFLYSTVMDMSAPSWQVAPLIKTKVAIPLYHQLRNMIHPPGSKTITERDPLHLQPGEWVQVRPIDEIKATLDERNRYKGLFFMPEMKQYCGGKFSVFKKVKTIKLESTGEVRELKSPTVFLEGVYCNGNTQDGCDRACFHFWREAWLKRISDDS